MLEASKDNLGIQDSILKSDGAGREFLHMKAGGSLKPASHATVDAKEHFVFQDGQPVFKAAVKSMAASFLERVNKEYTPYNVFGRVLAPTYVISDYSKSLRGQNQALTPAEVAIQVFEMAINATEFMRVQKVDTNSDGSYGFELKESSEEEFNDTTLSVTKRIESQNEDKLESRLFSAIQRVLPKCSEKEIIKGGLDLTNGWDSLAQIQIMLAVEKEMHITFLSNEIESLSTFNGIAKACQNHLSKI